MVGGPGKHVDSNAGIDGKGIVIDNGDSDAVQGAEGRVSVGIRAPMKVSQKEREGHERHIHLQGVVSSMCEGRGKNHPRSLVIVDETGEPYARAVG